MEGLCFCQPKILELQNFLQDFKLDRYFHVLPDDLAMSFCHFRSLNHKMPIEWDRFVGTLRDDRICELCFLDKIGNEFHYFFVLDMGSLFAFRGSTRCPAMWTIDRLLFYEWPGVDLSSLYRPICPDGWIRLIMDCIIIITIICNMIGK